MESIKKTKDFSYVYRRGKSKADRNLVLYSVKKQHGKRRFGISVSKKVGNSVIRHRIKRRLVEIARLNEQDFPNGYDYVVLARKPAAGADYHTLNHSVMKLIDN